MRIRLYINKSLEENASIYFEKAKKEKKKLEGAKEALKKSINKLKNLEKSTTLQEKKIKAPRKREWFEKFRWFYTSENNLFIAGRDATTNEILIKKYTDKDDLVFHTEMAGSPFGTLKSKSKKSIEEAAQFIACYSRAWKLGMTAMDVFYVNPDQVTKEAPSGEYIQKGSFMIYGKKTILSVKMELYIGLRQDGKIMAGPKSAVAAHCKDFVQIVQGNEKISAIAKKIKARFKTDDLDEIVRIIPPASKLIFNASKISTSR